MLDTFITSRVRRKIIVIYAKYPDFKTHVRGLAKLIKEDAGNIQTSDFSFGKKSLSKESTSTRLGANAPATPPFAVPKGTLT